MTQRTWAIMVALAVGLLVLAGAAADAQSKKPVAVTELKFKPNLDGFVTISAAQALTSLVKLYDSSALYGLKVPMLELSAAADVAAATALDTQRASDTAKGFVYMDLSISFEELHGYALDRVWEHKSGDTTPTLPIVCSTDVEKAIISGVWTGMPKSCEELLKKDEQKKVDDRRDQIATWEAMKQGVIIVKEAK
jgi:hypothetical protein